MPSNTLDSSKKGTLVRYLINYSGLYTQPISKKPQKLSDFNLNSFFENFLIDIIEHL